MDESVRRFYLDLSEAISNQFNPQDVRIDVFRADPSDSVDYFERVAPDVAAVRVTHIPTGTVVTCKEYSLRIENKLMALIQLTKEVS